MQAESNEAFEQQYRKTLDSLLESIGRLDENAKAHLHEHYGLSPAFSETLRSEEGAMRLCEEAMRTLSEDYIEHFSAFKEGEAALTILQHLDKAEAIWQAESTLIRSLDAGGSEAGFLDSMREHAYKVVEEKLLECSKRCQRDASPENVAVCVALLALMDRMLGEFGHPVDGEERKKLREAALSFN